MKHNFLKKLTSLALVVLMVITMIPAFALNIGAEGDTYELVTDASQLEDGGKYLIVCVTKNMAMANQNGTYRNGVEVTITDNKITDAKTAQQVTLHSVSSGGWTLTTEEGDLYYTGSKNTVQSEIGNGHAWNIDVTADGTSITSATVSARKLQWNASSPRFACYTSNQTAISLFKLVTGGSTTPDPEPTCEHTNKETIPATAPSCTENGLTEGVKCTDCGDWVTPQVADPALGHNYVDGVCSRCGDETKVFSLVTDVNTLKVGDIIIIVAVESDVALGAQNSNNRGQIDITKADGSVALVDGVQQLTVEAGTKEGTFAFNTGAGYLYAASSGSNHLKVEETLSDNSSWSIEIDAKGVATVKAQGTNTHNWLRYNAGNKIFSCYGSGQQDIAIYQLPVDCDHTNTEAYNVPATCTDSGKTGGLLCSDCGVEVEAPTEVPATGHTDVNGICSVCTKPLTPVTIVDALYALESGATLANGPYTLTGVITSVDTEFDSQWNNVTVTITVTGADAAKPVKCYRLVGTGADLIKVGDVITVTGELKNYNGTFEFDSNCTLDSYAAPAVGELGLNINKSVTVMVGYTIPQAWLDANAGATLTFTAEGMAPVAVTIVPGAHTYSFDLTPGMINNALTLTLKVGETEIAVNDISVQAYTDKVLATDATTMGITEALYNALLDVLDAIDNYAKAADGDTGLTETFEDPNMSSPVVNDEAGIFGLVSANLNTMVDVMLAVDVADAASYTVSIKLGTTNLVIDEALSKHLEGGLVKITGLNPTHFNDDITVTVTDGTTTSTVTFTFNAYLKALYGANEAYQSMAAATYQYGVAVEAFLATAGV